MTPLSGYLISFLTGGITSLCLSIFVLQPNPMSLEEMRDRVAGYEECMQRTGRMRCYMRPPQFVELHELRGKIRRAELERIAKEQKQSK